MSAPPYPGFTTLPTTPFGPPNSSYVGNSMRPIDDGFLVTEDGNYTVSVMVVFFNNRSCTIGCDTQCENVCGSACSTACITSCGDDGCQTNCSTNCAPACNTTCATSCNLDCPQPMFDVFAVLDKKFTTATRNLAGSFNSVSAGGVLTFAGQGQMQIRDGQSITAIINNGSGDTPVDILLMAWSISLHRISPGKCV